MFYKKFNEREIQKSFQEENIKTFLKSLERFDKEIASAMRAQGYKLVNKAERTVIFSFGEVTFTRNRWYKNGKCKIPVDIQLGLKKHERYSKELLCKVVELARFMPYRKVVEVVERLYSINITKDTVEKAVKIAGKLLENKKDLELFHYQEDNKDKRTPEILFIEGDGVYVNARNEKNNTKKIELSHYIVHEGSKKISNNRRILLNKKQFIGTEMKETRKLLYNFLHNNYHLQENSILVTNSDAGRGYSYLYFHELAKSFNKAKHEHFVDQFHVKNDIIQITRNHPKELKDGYFAAINSHDKRKLKLMLDTTESVLDGENELNKFYIFKEKILKNFKFTKPSKLRGMKINGIGIMESQHRKITYRMKRRGMYWTTEGAKRMSQLILLNSEEIQDLFFGNWSQEFINLFPEGQSAAEVKKLMPSKVNHSLSKSFRAPHKGSLRKNLTYIHINKK